jgi:hypothetical protein
MVTHSVRHDMFNHVLDGTKNIQTRKYEREPPLVNYHTGMQYLKMYYGSEFTIYFKSGYVTIEPIPIIYPSIPYFWYVLPSLGMKA